MNKIYKEVFDLLNLVGKLEIKFNSAIFIA